MCTSRSGAAGRFALALLIMLLQAPPAPADPSVEPGVNAHVIVGMEPNSAFHVTCDEHPLYDDPVYSNEEGIVGFETPEDMEDSPTMIWVGVPAPPVISDVRTCAVGDTAALVCWNTDRPATSVVDCGLTTSYDITATGTGTVTTTHAVWVNGLEPESLYHYRVTSVDAFGNVSRSGDNTFVTDPPHLRISDLRIEELKAHCLTLSWTTNHPSDSRAVYGLDELYGSATPLDPALVTEHSVLIEGLTPGQTYHMRAWSTDAEGQVAISADISATTLLSDLEITNVAVVDTTSMTATIRWETAVDAVSTIEYGETDAYGLVHVVDEGYCTDHYAVLEDLEQETEYHFSIRCEDAGGDIVSSEDAVFMTKHPSQDILTLHKIMPKYIGTDSAVIGWMSNLPADSRVEYGTTAQYGLSASDSLFVTNHAVELSGLAENTTYHYRVVSRTEYGLESVSDDATFTTWFSPLEISNVEVVPGVASLTVNWTTNRPADSRVEYGETDGYGEVTPLLPDLVVQHSVTIDGLLPNQLYHVRAWSIDDWGYATSSGDHTGVTLPPALTIDQIEVVEIEMTCARVECWTSNPARCRVEYGLGDTLTMSTPMESDPITYHGINIENLLPGAAYAYRVVAVDHFGQEISSPPGAFETLPVEMEIPPVISGLTVRGESATSARITWTTDRPATSEVQYGTTTNYSSSIYDHSLVETHDVLLTELDFETVYHFRVRSVDEDGLATVTEDETFAIALAGDGMPPDVPDAPTVMTDATGIRIGLPEPEDPGTIVAFRVYRRAEDELFYEMIAEVPSTEGSFVDSETGDGLVYEYTVSAIDVWDMESARTAPVSAVAGLGADVRVWVYPNPVRERTTLRIAPPLSGTRRDAWGYTIRIYDASGRLVRTMSERGILDVMKNVEWDARDARSELVSSGVYFCETVVGGSKARVKLIVIR